MALTDIKLRSLKGGIKPDGTATSKNYKVTDEKGLYIEVTPKGGKRWRFKYRFGGKEKLLSLGVYPEVGLKSAREQRDNFKKLLAGGVDPSSERKAEKLTHQLGDTFKDIADEWYQKHSPNWSESYAKKNQKPNYCQFNTLVR
jgi:hypothetical protein